MNILKTRKKQKRTFILISYQLTKSSPYTFTHLIIWRSFHRILQSQDISNLSYPLIPNYFWCLISWDISTYFSVHKVTLLTLKFASEFLVLRVCDMSEPVPYGTARKNYPVSNVSKTTELYSTNCIQSKCILNPTFL